MIKTMYLYGAGGHAKVVMDILRAQGIEVAAFIDDNPALKEWCGIPVVQDTEGLSPVIVCIGDCMSRRKVVERLHCQFATAMHPSAVIALSAYIGEGSVVMQGVVIQVDASIGRHCIINTKASVDHDCRIGDFAHIAPGCTLSGNVEVGEGTWIGVGTTVIQGVKIGRNCMIGAGSVVVKDIPDNVVAYGCPCKVIRKQE